jgi:hypothetical protein
MTDAHIAAVVDRLAGVYTVDTAWVRTRIARILTDAFAAPPLYRTCARCHGSRTVTGVIPGPDVSTCPACHGTGRVAASELRAALDSLARQPHEPPCLRYYAGREREVCTCWMARATEFLEARLEAGDD